MMMKLTRKKYFPAVFWFVVAAFCFAAETSDEKAMRDIIQYGTDAEITELIKTLRAEKIDFLDSDLIGLATKTKSTNIVNGVYAFFAEREQNGLEDDALRIIATRYEEPQAKVIAALDYSGAVKNKDALAVLNEIIVSDNTLYHAAAIKAVGKIAYSGEIDWTETLIDYYNNRNPNDELTQEIIRALGNGEKSESLPFLLDLINNTEQRLPFRMSAVEAAGKIGDEAALDSLLNAAASDDPNLRASAIGALGSYQGEQVEAAILDAFRDTFFRTRLAAVQAAKKRKLREAIPYLRYRAEKDEAASIKEEAIMALGAMESPAANKELEEIFDNAKNGDKLRSLCAELLLKNDADAYADKIAANYNDAKKKNQNILAKGLLKALSGAKTNKVENLTAQLFASKDVTDKFYALDMTANNGFTAFISEAEKLAENQNASLSRRAKSTLEKLR
jgi:HEAT repeat protein